MAYGVQQRRGSFTRIKKGFQRSGDGRKKTCSTMQTLRLLLITCGVASMWYSARQFHFGFQFEEHSDASFQRAFSKEWMGGKKLLRPTKNNQTDSSLVSNLRKIVSSLTPKEETFLSNFIAPPVKRHTQEHRIIGKSKPEPPHLFAWDIPTDATFNKTIFEQKIQARKHFRQQLYREKNQRKLEHAAQSSRLSTNASLPIIPHLHQTPMFRRHLSWNLMVIVMADSQCPLTTSYSNRSYSPSVNATSRLLTTLQDVLQSNMVDVIAYLPRYHAADEEECHNQLFHAIVTTFPLALQQGQLQIVTSPKLVHDRGSIYRLAMNGLDFAYAADLGHQYADLVLFLQAGSQLLPEWWIEYLPVATEAPINHTNITNATITNSTTGNATDPPVLEPHLATSNRDYALEILRAWENQHLIDEQGIEHEMCYMNFATGVGEDMDRYQALENPTGSLWDSQQLMRFSLVLRSFSPYGKMSVAMLVRQYCHRQLWSAQTPRAPLLLFEYKAKGNEITYRPKIEGQTIPPNSTYPYVTVSEDEVPDWVTIPSSLLGPHPAGEENSLLQRLSPAALIPTATTIPPHPLAKQNWMTFVIPTAWRHTVGGGIKGNAYVVSCIRQLILIIQAAFNGAYKASILVMVSGRDATDIAQHHAGLEAEFRTEIRKGIVQLVDAPIDIYPTLHGLDGHYQDKEQRIRWRSKQNLDISAAYYAAKGMGKYIMVIEDDSGFRPKKMFNGIRQWIANLHRQYSPNDAEHEGVQIVVNGIGEKEQIH